MAPKPQPVDTPKTPNDTSYVVLLDNGDGTSGTLTIDGPRGTTTLDRPQTWAFLSGPPGEVSPVDDVRFQADFKATVAASPRRPITYRLYFDTRGSALDAASRAQLPRILQEVAKRPGVDVSVVGHTDTMGDADRNFTLGLTRAKGVADLLARTRQIDNSRISVESRGERSLLVKTADSVDEPRNRRVEVTIR